MIEAIVISFIVGFAVLHVAFKLSPKLVQQKMRDASAFGLNKLGFHAVAKRILLRPRTENKACGSGCDGCGTHAAMRDGSNVKDIAKVVQFYPRLK